MRRSAQQVTIAVVALVFSADVMNAAPLKSVLIREVPHVRQKPDFCGEACAEMFLRKMDLDIDQDFVFDQSSLDPALGRGCYSRELARALKQIGFKTGAVWTEVPAKSSNEVLLRKFDELHADLIAGVPSIVCMRYDGQPNAAEHFRLVLGYDARTEDVIYHEPADDAGAYCRMPLKQFIETWPLKYAAETWTIVRMRLEPGAMTSGRTSSDLTNADYAQHIRALKRKRPNDGFSIVIQKPFVVIGDEPIEMVRKRSTQTVKWAVDRLKQDFFEKDPDEILDIWLFRDSASYEEHANALFKSKPTTPFGYYSARDGALVMNISTGGGTLVHEIVHPFMAANFPECPSWFNEGLASLCEQASERDGHIIGLTNWRLPKLQISIREGKVPSFETLCSTSTREFYDQDKGTNYAQARYLCFYLQERGLLVKYYQAFRKKKDPTGYNTLLSILNVDDAEEFQKMWEQFVLNLKFGD
jgi:hypothetical protein